MIILYNNNYYYYNINYQSLTYHKDASSRVLFHFLSRTMTVSEKLKVK